MSKYSKPNHNKPKNHKKVPAMGNGRKNNPHLKKQKPIPPEELFSNIQKIYNIRNVLQD